MTEQETRVIDDAEFLPAVSQANALVLPVAEPRDLVDAMKKYQATKEAILHSSDLQDAGGGRTFVKRSGWAKLAIAFGISSEILPGFPKREYDDEGKLVGAECQVRAIAPNGRHADGWGYCSVDEPRFSRPAARQKLQHDLAATSETRARNRAYSNLFGHGEVSAEEMDNDPPAAGNHGTSKNDGHLRLAGAAKTPTPDEEQTNKLRSLVATLARLTDVEPKEVVAQVQQHTGADLTGALTPLIRVAAVDWLEEQIAKHELASQRGR